MCHAGASAGDSVDAGDSVEEGEILDDDSSSSRSRSRSDSIASASCDHVRKRPREEDDGYASLERAFLSALRACGAAHDNCLPLAVCAIDCEMCETAHGMELARFTLVSAPHGVLVDACVAPRSAIINYWTEFSGLTEEHLRNTRTTLSDVHRLLQRHRIIGSGTIVVGHSIESDLKAARLLVPRVVDSAVIYPHEKGMPHKHSLRALASRYLNKDIQAAGDGGHDSVEDAICALQLVVRLLAGRSGGADLADLTEEMPRDAFKIDRLNLLQACAAPASRGRHSRGDMPPGLQRHFFDKRGLKANPFVRFHAYSNISSNVSTTGFDEEKSVRSWLLHRVIGYTMECDSATAVQSMASDGNKDSHRFVLRSANAAVLLDECVRMLSESSSLNTNHGSAKQITWIDLPLRSENYFGNAFVYAVCLCLTIVESGSGLGLNSVLEIDSALERIFDAAGPETLLIVLTQADLTYIKLEQNRKQRLVLSL